MSGVVTAPTMYEPATIVAPVAMEMCAPNGGDATRSVKLCREICTVIAHPARPRNSGTVTNAVQPMARNPRSTRAVTASPQIRHQAHSGRDGMIDWRPAANTAVCTPNQPNRLTAMTSPMSVEPYRPNPVQRTSIEVARPSRIPAMPTKMQTTSRITEPSVIAQKAPQKESPAPSVAPRRNCVRSESEPKRCTATLNQE